MAATACRRTCVAATPLAAALASWLPARLLLLPALHQLAVSAGTLVLVLELLVLVLVVGQPLVACGSPPRA